MLLKRSTAHNKLPPAPVRVLTPPSCASYCFYFPNPCPHLPIFCILSPTAEDNEIGNEGELTQKRQRLNTKEGNFLVSSLPHAPVRVLTPPLLVSSPCQFRVLTPPLFVSSPRPSSCLHPAPLRVFVLNTCFPFFQRKRLAFRSLSRFRQKSNGENLRSPLKIVLKHFHHRQIINPLPRLSENVFMNVRKILLGGDHIYRWLVAWRKSMESVL